MGLVARNLLVGGSGGGWTGGLGGYFIPVGEEMNTDECKGSKRTVLSASLI